MKSYTNLEQSKNLSNILSLTSADMHYERAYFEGKQSDWFIALGRPIKSDDILPCWSLTALLDVLPEKYTELIKEGGMYRIIIKDSFMTCLFDNPVDACVAMVEKLHELNLL